MRPGEGGWQGRERGLWRVVIADLHHNMPSHHRYTTAHIPLQKLGMYAILQKLEWEELC